MLIVGLGNIGEKYKSTRHNVGFEVADSLLTKVDGNAEWKEEKKFKALVYRPKANGLLIAKPTTFMNSSGEAVAALSTFYKIKPVDLYVVHDDLDIKLGSYKIQLGVGPKVHGGLNSIYEKLGTKDFWHVRVGVDNRNPENRINGDDYVMGKFEEGEKEIRDKVIESVVKDIIEKPEL
jgi:peptidyl-tRNA hydrolase